MIAWSVLCLAAQLATSMTKLIFELWIKKSSNSNPKILTPRYDRWHFLAENRRPEQWRETKAIELNATVKTKTLDQELAALNATVANTASHS